MIFPSPLKWVLRLFVILAAFTAIGQVKVKDRSLENHYHEYVNSAEFQAWFGALARPVSWTGQKIGGAYAKLRKGKSSEDSSAR